MQQLMVINNLYLQANKIKFFSSLQISVYVIRGIRNTRVRVMRVFTII